MGSCAKRCAGMRSSGSSPGRSRRLPARRPAQPQRPRRLLLLSRHMQRRPCLSHTALPCLHQTRHQPCHSDSRFSSRRSSLRRQRSRLQKTQALSSHRTHLLKWRSCLEQQLWYLNVIKRPPSTIKQRHLSRILCSAQCWRQPWAEIALPGLLALATQSAWRSRSAARPASSTWQPS